MKSKFIKTIILLLLAITVISAIYVNNKTKNNINNLSGELLINEPWIGDEQISGSDYVTLNPDDCSLKPVDFQASNAIFFGNMSKFLIKYSIGNVELYDKKNNMRTNVFKTDSDNFQIAYVDNDRFSISDYTKIQTVRIKDGQINTIVNGATGKHSWCSDGKVLFYNTSFGTSEKEGIYSYNTETKEKNYITTGRKPCISRDGRILAYENDFGFLYVKNLATGKEWKYKYSPFDFCLSPDAKYVAVVEYWTGIGFYDGYTIKIWDYENNISKTVLPKYPNGRCRGIDWTE